MGHITGLARLSVPPGKLENKKKQDKKRRKAKLGVNVHQANQSINQSIK